MFPSQSWQSKTQETMKVGPHYFPPTSSSEKSFHDIKESLWVPLFQLCSRQAHHGTVTVGTLFLFMAKVSLISCHIFPFVVLMRIGGFDFNSFYYLWQAAEIWHYAITLDGRRRIEQIYKRRKLISTLNPSKEIWWELWEESAWMTMIKVGLRLSIYRAGKGQFQGKVNISSKVSRKRPKGLQLHETKHGLSPRFVVAREHVSTNSNRQLMLGQDMTVGLVMNHHGLHHVGAGRHHGDAGHLMVAQPWLRQGGWLVVWLQWRVMRTILQSNTHHLHLVTFWQRFVVRGEAGDHFRCHDDINHNSVLRWNFSMIIALSFETFLTTTG